MTPNVKLLKLVLGHIDMNKVTWDQGSWRRCFGGWACTFAGGHWYGPADGVHRDFLVAVPADDPADLVTFREGLAIGAYCRATRVLGLDRQQAFLPFHAGNTLADLHRIVDEICAGVES